jgi:signal transduction histidine kinase
MEPNQPPRLLVLPPLLGAIDAWQAEPTAASRRELVRALDDIAQLMGVSVEHLRVSAPPLADLELDLGRGSDGTDTALVLPGDTEPIGTVRISGAAEQAAALTHALERGFLAARVRAQADRARRQLTALDQAVRGISGTLDVDLVLQLIADRVRELVSAQYAAIGIIDHAGTIERFITSGITDEERKRIGELPHGRGLLGLIIRENRTYRIPDIAAHEESYGFPPNHPPMRSFLGMPIATAGSVVGRLYLTNKLDAGEFSEEDQGLVEMFALHAGIAIENARLHDQVGRLAVVDERDRISRDLHDSVIQSIYGQTLALDDVPDLIDDDPTEAKRRVDEAIDALHAVSRDIRNFIFGLRPVLLDAGSLTDGLRHLATELHRNGGVEVEVTAPDDDALVEGLAIELVAELLTISREALSNIARHAAASRATVRLGIEADGLSLHVSDDGRGFDVDRAGERGHHGIANIRARSEALGGTFSVASTPGGGGTTIIIRVPHRRPSTES